MVIGAVEGQSEVDVAKQAGTLVRAYHYVLQYAMAKNALLFTDQYLYSAELDTRQCIKEPWIPSQVWYGMNTAVYIR